MVHNEPEIFKILISMLDDSRNDIFVHVDQKSEISLFNSVKTKKSKIYFTQQRIKNFGGSPTQMETEFLLFEEAIAHLPYRYYHLLSGVDLPLKTQDYIHDKLDNQLYDWEYVGYIKDLDIEKSPVIKRVKYWYFHLTKLRSENKYLDLFYKIRRHIEILIQIILRVNRIHSFTIGFGPNWISVTQPFLEYLISQKCEVLKTFRRTFCVDEIFVQSVLLSSPFKDKVYDRYNEYHSCLRKIDWERGTPYTWTIKDFEELTNNDYLFARKFSSADMDIIYKLRDHLVK